MSKSTGKSIYKIEKENQILRQKVSNLTKEIEKKNETIEQRDEWIKSLKQYIVTVEFNQLTIFEAMDGYKVDEIENISPEKKSEDENGESLVLIGYECSERLHRVPEKWIKIFLNIQLFLLCHSILTVLF